jgi:hypothetical protein
MTASLPTDAAARKAAPMAEGLLYYFPAALAEVARVSKAGNDQHNPGQPLHHSRGKSSDHADCIIRHLADAGLLDSDGMRHSAKVAWRALALLQEELERAGAPLPRNARLPEADNEPPMIGEAIALADGVTANGAGLVPAHIAEMMVRDGVIPRDDDEGEMIPVESLGRDA